LCKHRNEEAGNGDKEGTLLRFLTQIYSPADSAVENEDAFHRSLYVFCCPHPLCSSSENAHESVVVLRGQLPKENMFYPNDCNTIEDEAWKKHHSDTWDINLCIMCGQRASGKCPIAEKWFCCKDHQRDYHKALKKAKETNQQPDLNPYIYKESELVVEEEPMEESDENANDENDFDEINKASIFANGEGDESDELLEQSDLNEMTGSGAGTTDPTTLDFYIRTGRANGSVKSQCLRYCRWPNEDLNVDDLENGNGPLWISSENQPIAAGDIPPCEYCGVDRKFEFQVMPQMVTFLQSCMGNEEIEGSSLTEEGKNALIVATDIVDKAREEGNEMDLPEGFKEKHEALVDKFKASLLQDGKKDEALDFGTIAVFSCTASCDGKNKDESLGGYKKEFAWRQKPLE
jgi:pre-rRNA-processing protein TSR4